MTIRTLPNTQLVQQLDSFDRGTKHLYLAPKNLRPGQKGVLVPVGVVEMTDKGHYRFAEGGMPPGAYPVNGKLINYRV